MDDNAAPPASEHLRRALDDEAQLLTGPDVSDVVKVRVRRAVDSARDLLDVSDAEPVRDVAGRTLAWLAESVLAFQRLPRSYASGNAVEGDPAPLLHLVDQLDLLGLTLDHAYDAAYRSDDDALERQRAVLRDRFAARSSAAGLAEPAQITPEDLDLEVVRSNGLEVGEDGIPRVPVPDPPRPTQEDQG